jgi:hypothetical protein
MMEVNQIMAHHVTSYVVALSIILYNCWVIYLNTYGFIKEEGLLLIDVLNKKFKLNCSIHKHNSRGRIDLR